MSVAVAGVLDLGSRTLTAERLEGAADVLEGEYVGKVAPGAVLAVARSEGPMVVRAFGRAAWQPVDVPARPDTIFLLASITKLFTATAVMQQVERGRVLLDDPVVRYVPEFGARGKSRVTVRQLLTHTSGLDEAWLWRRVAEDRSRAASWERSVASICDAPLAFLPGTAYAYCNPSMTILGEIVRRADGRTFDAYLRDEVWAPLGMSDTSFDPPPAAAERVSAVAPGTWPAAPEGVAPPSTDLDELIRQFRAVPQPAAGAWSTAADLVAFGRAYLHGLRGRRANGVRLLAPATMAAMLRPQTEGPSQRQAGRMVPAQPLGLGFVLVGREAGADLHSSSACGHNGASGTRLVIDPEQDLVTVFLTNKWDFGDDDRRVRAMAINAAVAATSGE